jgi:uncharacterized protein involved in exopolysaccharide biosynthesis
MWIIELLEIVVRQRRFVVANTILIGLLAFLVTIVLPPRYHSKTTILPPESQAGILGTSDISMAQVANAVTNFSLPLMATPSDLYARMIKSDAVLSEVVDSLNLKSVYNEESIWSAVEELRDDLSVEVTAEGIISLEVLAPEAHLAAEIANAVVQKLDQLIRRTKQKSGGLYVDFLAARITECDQELESAQRALQLFQEEHLTISPELQSAALIDNLAQHKADLTREEIELELLRHELGTGHPQLVMQKRRVDEIRRKLREIETGAQTRSDSVVSAMDIPLEMIPELSLQFAVLKRNVRIQEIIYETLAEQYELARIQERRNTPALSVLDIARPSNSPVWPRKLLTTAAALIVGFVLSILIAVIRFRLSDQTIQEQPAARQLRELFTVVRRKPLG